MVRSITPKSLDHFPPSVRPVLRLVIKAQEQAATFYDNPSAPGATDLSTLSSVLCGLLQVAFESREPGRELRVGGSDGGAGIRVFTAPTTRPAAPAPTVGLAFGGVAIRDRNDRVSLTDMWKAAGSDRNKRPGEWLRQDSTGEFLAHIRVTMGHAHSLTETREGRGGGTWAHWQVAMAYAKYLSPEFHAWCNSVVREHMEARGARRLP